jgi:hypothetical protein
MVKEKFLIFIACLVSNFLFGEEEQKFSLKEMNIADTEKAFENAAKNSLFPLIEGGLGSGDITIQSESENSHHGEIAYPIDESNFEEIFGRIK